jgi:hypothetical protein
MINYENQQKSIVKMINVARLKWLGHIVRMEDNVSCRQITSSQSEGSITKARPRLRRLDLVLKNLETLKVNGLWKKAWDKDLWSEMIKEAKAYKGL